ncbi:EamA family transporter [Bacteroidota bacterium]
MIYLILSILFSTSILVWFKFIEKRGHNILIAIIVNYVIAVIAGLLMNYNKIDYEAIEIVSWWYFAIIMGVLFIINFIVMGISIKKAGISATSVATKMSVIIPIIFSIVFYSESLGLIKLFGIIIALLAVFLSVVKKTDNKKFNIKYSLFPVYLFLGSGIIDSLIKYSQASHINENNISIFSASIFGVSAISGIVFLLFRFKKYKEQINPGVLFSGSVLGLLNFGALYSIINALENNKIASSSVFLINSVSIVSLSVLIAVLFFREKPGIMNWIGIALSIIAIFILTNS